MSSVGEIPFLTSLSTVTSSFLLKSDSTPVLISSVFLGHKRFWGSKLGVMAHAHRPCIWDIEQEAELMPALATEQIKASLDYMRPCLKEKEKRIGSQRHNKQIEIRF